MALINGKTHQFTERCAMHCNWKKSKRSSCLFYRNAGFSLVAVCSSSTLFPIAESSHPLRIFEGVCKVRSEWRMAACTAIYSFSFESHTHTQSFPLCSSNSHSLNMIHSIEYVKNGCGGGSQTAIASRRWNLCVCSVGFCKGASECEWNGTVQCNSNGRKK